MIANSKSKVQSLIIHSLSKGVEDQKSDSLKVRHAMSAIEINSIMAETYKFEINKSNLWYHIQKLIEQGIIKVISSVQKSNIVSSYYCKTSKLIFSDNHSEGKESKKDKSDKKIEHQNSRQNFTKDEPQINEIKNMVKKVKKIRIEYHREFMHWMIDNDEQFRGL